MKFSVWGLTWGSFLVFPFMVFLILFLIVCVRGFFQGKFKMWSFLWRMGLVAGLFLMSLFFVYIRFIVPFRITVIETELDVFNDGRQPLRVAVIADPQLGIFKGRGYMERVIDITNAQNPDVVLLAGDYVYFTEKNHISDLMAPFSRLESPAFGVLGNHDHGIPYERDYSGQISDALKDNGVSMIDNAFADVALAGRKYRIVGIGDLDAENVNYDLIKELGDLNEDLILLFHNPDVAPMLPEDSVAFSVAGHTHCGQINIPFISKHLIPTKGDFFGGLYKINGNPLYISCGLGEGGLPIRFRLRPELSLLTIK